MTHILKSKKFKMLAQKLLETGQDLVRLDINVYKINIKKHGSMTLNQLVII